MIGGATAAARNLICNNTGAGVVVSGGTTTGVSILGNHIYSNGGLGIDLTGGSNHLQNFPVIISAVEYNNQFTVKGALSASPNATYRIELFVNDAADVSGFGEGQTYLGFVNVATDAGGNVVSVGDSSGTA